MSVGLAWAMRGEQRGEQGGRVELGAGDGGLRWLWLLLAGLGTTQLGSCVRSSRAERWRRQRVGGVGGLQP